MTKTVIKFEKAADLSAAIASIATRGSKLQADIHTAAVSCLHHADAHGDVTLMQALITALPGMARRNALIAWAITFGKFTADATGKNVEFDKTAETDLASADAKPFWDFKPEQPFQPFDLNAEIEKLVKKAEKAQADDRNVVPAEKFLELRKLKEALAA